MHHISWNCEFDPEIEKRAKRLAKKAKLRKQQASSPCKMAKEDPSRQYWPIQSTLKWHLRQAIQEKKKQEFLESFNKPCKIVEA